MQILASYLHQLLSSGYKLLELDMYKDKEISCFSKSTVSENAQIFVNKIALGIS